MIKLQHHILATGTSNDAPQPSALISDAIKYPRAPINIVSGEVQAPRPQDVHYQQHQQQHQQQQQLPLPQMDTRMSGMSLADTRQGSGQSMGGNASLSQDQARAMQAAMYPVQAVQALNEVTHQQIQQQRQAQQAQAAQEAQQQQAAIDEAERQRRELEAQALGAIHDETTIPSQRNEAFNQARMAAQTGSTPRSDSQSQSVSTPSQASQAFSPSSAQAQGMTMGQARSPEEELQRQLANLPPVPGDPSTNNGGPLPMPEL